MKHTMLYAPRTLLDTYSLRRLKKHRPKVHGLINLSLLEGINIFIMPLIHNYVMVKAATYDLIYVNQKFIIKTQFLINKFFFSVISGFYVHYFKYLGLSAENSCHLNSKLKF